jgi:hypothetical protein
VDPVELGNLAASGWRAKVADALADPLSNVAPVKPEQARALVGAGFFVLSVVYVVKTSRRAVQHLRA